nr:MAG TPA: hypothetical protein [Bacteriophage sp.]DAX83720.1 MAG TPA: hypothetical protein [Caudoviricetes sp.]
MYVIFIYSLFLFKEKRLYERSANYTFVYVQF